MAVVFLSFRVRRLLMVRPLHWMSMFVRELTLIGGAAEGWTTSEEALVDDDGRW